MIGACPLSGLFTLFQLPPFTFPPKKCNILPATITVANLREERFNATEGYCLFQHSLSSSAGRNGNLDKQLEPELSDSDAVKLWTTMFRAREIDSRLLKLQRQGRIGTFAPATGQEAAISARRSPCGIPTGLSAPTAISAERLMRGEPLIKRSSGLGRL